MFHKAYLSHRKRIQPHKYHSCRQVEGHNHRGMRYNIFLRTLSITCTMHDLKKSKNSHRQTNKKTNKGNKQSRPRYSSFCSFHRKFQMKLGIHCSQMGLKQVLPVLQQIIFKSTQFFKQAEHVALTVTKQPTLQVVHELEASSPWHEKQLDEPNKKRLSFKYVDEKDSKHGLQWRESPTKY